MADFCIEQLGSIEHLRTLSYVSVICPISVVCLEFMLFVSCKRAFFNFFIVTRVLFVVAIVREGVKEITNEIRF